jgi:hypothetical protein
MWQVSELRLNKDKASLSPQDDDEEENEVGTNARGAQDAIAAKLEEKWETAGRRQGALHGPLPIEQRNIVGLRTVAQGRAPATVAQG